MMHTGLIQESELMEWSGHKRREALAEWLRSQGIPFMIGKGGRICCTDQAVNVPLLHNFNEKIDIEF